MWKHEIVPRYSKVVRISIGAIVLLFVFVVRSPASAACNAPKYEERNQIDYGPLRLTRVVGTAIDSTGAPVPKTCIYLFTEKTHHLSAITEVDSEGKFSMYKVKAGSYRLVVASEGFCTANIPLTVASRAAYKRLVVHMKMAEIDVCSYGDYK